MITDVYVDVLFLVNFSMDLLSLYVCSRINSQKVSKFRLVTSAVLGALYSVFSLLFYLSSLVDALLFMLCCVFMCIIAFSFNGILACLKQCVVLFCVSALIGGIMSASYSVFNNVILSSIKNSYTPSISPLSFFVIASFSIVVALIFGSMYGSSVDEQKVLIKLKLFANNVETYAIVDSGNLLVDPLSLKKVIILNSKLCTHLLSDAFNKGVLDNDISIAKDLPIKEKKRFRPIYCKGVGEGICLYSLVFDDVVVEYISRHRKVKKRLDVLVAIASHDQLDNVECIIPASLLN